MAKIAGLVTLPIRGRISPWPTLFLNFLSRISWATSFVVILILISYSAMAEQGREDLSSVLARPFINQYCHREHYDRMGTFDSDRNDSAFKYLFRLAADIEISDAGALTSMKIGREIAALEFFIEDLKLCEYIRSSGIRRQKLEDSFLFAITQLFDTPFMVNLRSEQRYFTNFKALVLALMEERKSAIGTDAFKTLEVRSLPGLSPVGGGEGPSSGKRLSGFSVKVLSIQIDWESVRNLRSVSGRGEYGALSLAYFWSRLSLISHEQIIAQIQKAEDREGNFNVESIDINEESGTYSEIRPHVPLRVTDEDLLMKVNDSLQGEFANIFLNDLRSDTLRPVFRFRAALKFFSTNNLEDHQEKHSVSPGCGSNSKNHTLILPPVSKIRSYNSFIFDVMIEDRTCLIPTTLRLKITPIFD